MEEFHVIPYLREILIILVSAGILVPLFNRFKLSPVLGYLAVGFIVGPFGLGAIATSSDNILHYLTIGSASDVSVLAEFGIVFLMFMIGLELSPQRLWAMRRMVFGLGTLQVVISTCVIGGAMAFFFGKSLGAAVVVGTAMALSSTAIVMQILTDRHLIATPVGRGSFSILLFQDIAVVPILILIGLLGGGTTAGAGMIILLALVKAIAAIVFVMGLGPLLMRPIYRLAGSSKSAEPFMAITFLTVILAAVITGIAGLSMALGAFLGGLLLAETQYRHAIEVYIEPFKGLLLGLFFMTVGMGIDPGIIRVEAVWILGAVIGLVLVKAAIVSGLGILFGLSRGVAVEMGLLLSQAGEFAFVLIGTATVAKVISAPLGQFLLVVASLSMVVTPFVALLAGRIGPWIDGRKPGVLPPDAPESIPEMQGHILIAGFGRVGKAVATILQAESIPYLALDTDAESIAEQRKLGHPVIYGDALRGDLLKHCHPEQAKAVLVTMADTKVAVQVIKALRHKWPDVPIFSRARDLKAAKELRKAGATIMVAETIEASLQLASSLLRGIGTHEDMVSRRMALSREYAMNRIQEQD